MELPGERDWGGTMSVYVWNGAGHGDGTQHLWQFPSGSSGEPFLFAEFGRGFVLDHPFAYARAPGR
jgi:hypothetical protein